MGYEITPVWNIQTFGRFRVESEAGPAKFRTKKTAGLVASLIVCGRQHRAALAALLWPHSTESAARQSLRMALSDIRATMGPIILTPDSDWVEIDCATLQVDLLEFNKFLRSSPPDFASALAKVTGPLLPEFDQDWVVPEWLSLQDQIASAATDFALQCVSDGEILLGTQVVRRILGILGCREDLHIALIRLAIAAGMPSLALAQFQQLELELDDLWGEPPSQRAIDLIESIPKGRTGPIPASHGGQPGASNAMIGRDALMARVLKELIPGRIVTLTGPGGSGKTTLARSIWDQSDSLIPGPHVFVDLTSATSREGALRLIELEIGLPRGELPELFASIRSYLHSSPGLIILDNFEQLVAQAADLPAELSEACPESRFLVTSRIHLPSAGGITIPVEPLELPKSGMSLDEIRATASVQLFERQAVTVNARFRVTADNATSVVALCRKLDGLPLALELAAARVTIYSPAQILVEIHRSLDQLVTNRVAKDERQAGLAQAIEWSFGLLTPAAQDVFLKATLVAGPFDARTLAGIVGLPSVETELEELVQSSFLNSDPSKSTTVFWAFETIRQFGIDRLRRVGGYGRALSGFTKYLADFADRILNDDMLGSEAKSNVFFSNADNFLTALVREPASSADAADRAHIAVSLAPFFNLYSLGERVSATLEYLFRSHEASINPRRRAQLGAAWCRVTSNVSSEDSKLAVLTECARLAGDDLGTLTEIAFRRGNLLKSSGSYDEAMNQFVWALKNTPVKDVNRRASLLYNCGLVASCLGHDAESLDYNLQALREARKGDDKAQLVRILFDTGSELANQGRAEEALPLFDEAIDHCQRLNSRKLEGLTRWQLGDALLSMGLAPKALREIQQSVQLVVESGFRAGLKWIFLQAADALARVGHFPLATRMVAKMVETRTSERRPLAANEIRVYDRLAANLKVSLGTAKFERFWSQGAGEPWEALVQEFCEVTA